MNAKIGESFGKNKKNLRITDEPIPTDLQERVAKKITLARVKMLFHQPFFGTLVTRMQIFAADKWLPTMAVDGKYLYFNHSFVDALEVEELVFVFAHEVLHIVYDHLGRRYDRDPELFNCANDYIVNDELIQANVGTFPKSVPGLHDIKYRGWSSEQVYDDLLKQQQKNGGNGKMNGMSLDELVDKLLDEHLNNSNENGDSKKSSGPTESGPAKLTEEEKKQLKAQLKQEIINSAKLAQAGTLPAGVQRLVDDLTAPKMDWRSLLQTQLSSLIPSDYSFLKVNRKGWDLDVILPGMTEEKMLNIAVALDMSGSITNEMVKEFLSEIKGIMDQYPMYEIRVFCFDTKCYADRTFSTDNGERIETYQPAGGGGTDAGAIFEYLKEQNYVPMKLVVFTDGYVGGNWGDENYTNVLWIINNNQVIPPWGMHAVYDGKEK